jgi:hypothetical protein
MCAMSYGILAAAACTENIHILCRMCTTRAESWSRPYDQFTLSAKGAHSPLLERSEHYGPLIARASHSLFIANKQ